MRINLPSALISAVTRFQAIFAGEHFELLPSVQPVSLVDSGVTITAVATTPLLGTPVTEGDKVAPGADTVLATSGAKDAGEYIITVQVFANEANSFLLQRRNAADAANIWFIRLRWADAGKPMVPFSLRVRLETNERIRIVNEAAAGGGTTYQAVMWVNAA